MRMQRQEAAHREVERYTMDPAIQDDIKQVGHYQHSKGSCHEYEDNPRDKPKTMNFHVKPNICFVRTDKFLAVRC